MELFYFHNVFFSSVVFAKETPTAVEFKNLPLESFQNQKVSYTDLKGKVIIIDFWTSWCTPCKEALPHYNQLFNKFKNKGLIVLGINEDEDIAERDAFLKLIAWTSRFFTTKINR